MAATPLRARFRNSTSNRETSLTGGRGAPRGGVLPVYSVSRVTGHNRRCSVTTVYHACCFRFDFQGFPNVPCIPGFRSLASVSRSIPVARIARRSCRAGLGRAAECPHACRMVQQRALRDPQAAACRGLSAARAAGDPRSLARLGLRPVAGRTQPQGHLATHLVGELAGRHTGVAKPARLRCTRRGRRHAVGLRRTRHPLSRWRPCARNAIAGRLGRRGGSRIRYRRATFSERWLCDCQSGQAHGVVDRPRQRVPALGQRWQVVDAFGLSARSAALVARHAACRSAGRVSRRVRRH